MSLTLLKQLIIEVVNEIPEGYVSTYGNIAREVRKRNEQRTGELKKWSAQMIGRQLSGMPEEQWPLLPRRRVVAKGGVIASVKLGEKGARQITLLEGEGWSSDGGVLVGVDERVVQRGV